MVRVAVCRHAVEVGDDGAQSVGQRRLRRRFGDDVDVVERRRQTHGAGDVLEPGTAGEFLVAAGEERPQPHATADQQDPRS